MSKTVADIDLQMDFEDLLDAADAEARNGWEMDFLSDMRARFEEYGERMFVSDKQIALLLRIAKEE